MPKANYGGATAAGMTGIVEHGAPLADGRTLSELDPELNLDGTLIEGEHPDHPKAEEREEGTVHAGPDTLPRPIDDPYEVVHDDDDSNEKPTDSEDKPKSDEKPAEADDSRSDVRSAPAKTPAKEEEGVPFPGSSSATLSKSTASTRGTSSKRR